MNPPTAARIDPVFIERRLANEERLRLAMESAKEGLWDWNVTTGTLFVCRQGLGMLGYEEGELELTLALWLGLCHPEDRSEFQRRLREHMEGTTPFYEFEHRLEHKNGQWLWLLNRARVVARDAQGRPLRMVGTLVDITHQKRGEERLHAMMQALPDLLFRMRVDGLFLDVKADFPDEMAMPPEAIIGKNIQHLPLPRPFVDGLLAHLERAVRDGRLLVYEYELQVPRGLQQYESRIVRSGPDECLCIVRNITERKQAEAKLRQQEEDLKRHRDRLAELVQEATRKLEAQQAQLIQSEKMASLGQMAAGIAHEINNPMSYIASNLGTLGDSTRVILQLLHLYRELEDSLGSGASPPPAELLERIRALRRQEDVDRLLADMRELIHDSLEGAQRVDEIVQGLRMFARPESGPPQWVDMNKLLESTLKLVRNQLRYKCTVLCDYGSLPLLPCLPTQISQVFTNLFINAAQAMEERGELRITTRHEGDEVVVRVADTGSGMTPETLARLFTPFFTTKPAGKGTGLGLSICYGIIHRHQGRIEVQSEPGRGSTFTVRLPVSPEPPKGPDGA
jgi:PAS domain S-box-containing protein